MRQLPLFGDSVLNVPSTQGIKYAGSKQKLLPHILQLVKKTDASLVWDGFSGTTRVSQALAKSGYVIVSSDIAIWSEIFSTCYLLNHKQLGEYKGLIDHLNSVAPIEGWFTKNYGGYDHNGSAIQQDGLKKPWQVHNTRKLDAIRNEIDQLRLSTVERAVALTSLILALDEVDNTLGHFVSYLSQWSPRSYKALKLRVPEVFVTNHSHEVRRGDVFDLVNDISCDLAYFDPPYGSNNEKMPPSRIRYSAYYHLWTTICLNDEPELFGKAMRRVDTSDSIAASVFEEFRRDSSGRYIAVDAIDRLLRQVDAKWIILSYNSGGRATAAELNNVISSNGKIIEVLEVNHKKHVMAGMRWTNEWVDEAAEPNREFLFLISK